MNISHLKYNRVIRSLTYPIPIKIIPSDRRNDVSSWTFTNRFPPPTNIKCNETVDDFCSMALAPKSVLLILVAVILVTDQVLSRPLLGGWQPIANPNAPKIKEIGKFAVEEHNRAVSGSSYKPLGFLNVVRGEYQIVAGINYRLFIKAKKDRGSTVHMYKATVFDRSWEKIRKLRSFRLYA